MSDPDEPEDTPEGAPESAGEPTTPSGGDELEFSDGDKAGGGRQSPEFEEMSAPADTALAEDPEDKSAADLETVFDVPVRISAVLGRTRIPVASLLKMDVGSVLELDRKVGEAIDVYVNDRLVARGEIVLVENQLGITMTEIIRNG